MARRKIEPIRTYVNEDGVTVNVYAEKQVKRIPWQRGEAYLGMKMRIQEETGPVMYQFTRKNGKY